MLSNIKGITTYYPYAPKKYQNLFNISNVLGERTHHIVAGFHNWLQYWLQQKKGQISEYEWQGEPVSCFFKSYYFNLIM